MALGNCPCSSQSSSSGRPNRSPLLRGCCRWPRGDVAAVLVEAVAVDSLAASPDPWLTLLKTFWSLMDDFTFFSLVLCEPESKFAL